MIAQQVVIDGDDAAAVARRLVDELAAPDLRLALVFAHWRLDPYVLAATVQRGLAPAAVVGCTATDVIGRPALSRGGPADPAGPRAVALGLYGDWVRAGVGVAPDLPKSALMRSRDAVHAAAAALGLPIDALDPARHVGVTIVDGTSGHEEAFCIGSAAAAPQLRFVGGCASTELPSDRRALVWAKGEVLGDAGVVVLLASELPFLPLSSSHLVPTALKTVVTSAAGRVIDELDGYPAVPRLAHLLGPAFEDARTASYTFARYIDGVPYVRSMTLFEGDRIHTACAVEAGHVLHVMRSGDLIGTTARDLAAAAARVGGMSACLVFSCLGRHWAAAASGIEGELAATYAAYPTAGMQSFGEQAGMLLVNHTLTGLAIGRSAAGAPGA